MGAEGDSQLKGFMSEFNIRLYNLKNKCSVADSLEEGSSLADGDPVVSPASLLEECRIVP